MKTYVNKKGYEIQATEKAYKLFYEKQGFMEKTAAKKEETAKETKEDTDAEEPEEAAAEEPEEVTTEKKTKKTAAKKKKVEEDGTD